MNSVQLVGRLTKDPELKYSQSGAAIARFTLAVNRSFKKDGQQEADFINCIAFSKTAENLANYQSKGSQIGLIGRIQTGSYENSEGKRVYTTDIVANEIVFLGSKKEENQENNSQNFSNEVNDEDLPF